MLLSPGLFAVNLSEVASLQSLGRTSLYNPEQHFWHSMEHLMPSPLDFTLFVAWSPLFVVTPDIMDTMISTPASPTMRSIITLIASICVFVKAGLYVLNRNRKNQTEKKRSIVETHRNYIYKSSNIITNMDMKFYLKIYLTSLAYLTVTALLMYFVLRYIIGMTDYLQIITPYVGVNLVYPFTKLYFKNNFYKSGRADPEDLKVFHMFDTLPFFLDTLYAWKTGYWKRIEKYKTK